MTPKEKAKWLYKKFDELLPCEGTTPGQTPIDCAIITVDESINTLKSLGSIDDMKIKFAVKHWEWVKDELQKL